MHENPQYYDSTTAQDNNRHLSGLSYWSIIVAYGLAAAEGIKLTDGHFEVIDYLREDYTRHGPRQHSGQLLDALERRFREYGGIRYVNQLFPHGPLSQAMKIAGLPLPEHREYFATRQH